MRINDGPDPAVMSGQGLPSITWTPIVLYTSIFTLYTSYIQMKTHILQFPLIHSYILLLGSFTRHDISDIQLLLGQDLSMVSLYFPSAPYIGREWFGPSAYSVVVHPIDPLLFMIICCCS